MFLGMGWCWDSLCNCLVECWDGLVLDCGFRGELVWVWILVPCGVMRFWNGCRILVFWSVGIYLGYDLV